MSTKRQKHRYLFHPQILISSCNSTESHKPEAIIHTQKKFLSMYSQLPTNIFTTCDCSSFKSLIIIDMGEGDSKYLLFTHRDSMCMCDSGVITKYDKFTWSISYVSLGNCKIALPVTLCSLVPTFFFITSH